MSALSVELLAAATPPPIADAGNFGMDVPQTLKTWSVMETVISVVGLGFVMLLSLVM